MHGCDAHFEVFRYEFILCRLTLDVYAHSFAYMLNIICSTSSGQIDPSEKLDPSVEDALVEVAEDFIESVSSSTYTIRSHELVFFST